MFNYHGPGELCLLGSNWTVFILPHQDVGKELIRRKGSMFKSPNLGLHYWYSFKYQITTEIFVSLLSS